MPSPAHRAGLEGVIVADSRLSEVDGERGRLVIAGSDVEDLAGRISFEELAHRLWSLYLPDSSPDRIRTELGEARLKAFALIPTLGDALEAQDGMDALRAAVSHLRESGPLPLQSNIWVTAATGVFAAAWAAKLQGGRPVPPDRSAGHAADILRMATGEKSPTKAKGFESYLVTVSDHGMNASTFTARVIASTASDIVSSVVGAIGALKGPLHGGAPGPVLEMLDAIGRPERATEWLEAEIAAGRRIMGMGHRIYRVRDPRAAVLEQAVLQLERSGIGTPRLRLARAVEEVAEGLLRKRHPDRPLNANVEFYTAVLLDALGFPRSLFSSLFACGRVVGWCAHIAEQRATGRLIRPESRYIGPRPL